jgi:hypothetical protein
MFRFLVCADYEDYLRVQDIAAETYKVFIAKKNKFNAHELYFLGPSRMEQNVSDEHCRQWKVQHRPNHSGVRSRHLEHRAGH